MNSTAHDRLTKKPNNPPAPKETCRPPMLRCHVRANPACDEGAIGRWRLAGEITGRTS
jgi:hypothetical protein